jgi:hypothetical protein
MPARSLRVQLFNASGFDLKLSFSHLCQGNWTDNPSPSGHWTPPPTIPNNESGDWQSESAGVLTGTEGYVKYQIQVIGTDNNNKPLPHDTVYIYWTVPFIGIPTCKPSTSTEDIEPDCDFQKSPSRFQPPSKFQCVSGVSGNPGSGFEWTPSATLIATHPVIPALIPVLTILNAGDAHQVIFAATVGPLPNTASLKAMAQQIGFDPKLGIRRLAPQNPSFSLRALLRLP